VRAAVINAVSPIGATASTSAPASSSAAMTAVLPFSAAR
jgi:hypothetical protein